MSIFHRIPAADVACNFTHRGWLGFCPVWVNERSWAVTERNWVPEWATELAAKVESQGREMKIMRALLREKLDMRQMELLQRVD